MVPASGYGSGGVRAVEEAKLKFQEREVVGRGYILEREREWVQKTM